MITKIISRETTYEVIRDLLTSQSRIPDGRGCFDWDDEEKPRCFRVTKSWSEDGNLHKQIETIEEKEMNKLLLGLFKLPEGTRIYWNEENVFFRHEVNHE